MSDDQLSQEKPFLVEIAKQGRAVCKKCKQKCVQGDLRIAKMVPNPVGTGRMKNWHHGNCIFEVFLKQRQTTKRIEGPQDLEGWDLLNDEDRGDILEKIKECNDAFEVKLHKTLKKCKSLGGKGKSSSAISDDSLSVSSDSSKDGAHKDNCFREFRTVVANIAKVNSSSEKINILRDIFSKGTDGTGFKGDIVLWCKLLLPAVIKRVFHLQTTQLVKLFSQIFGISEKTMSEFLEQSDIGQTLQHFFEQNKKFKPAKKSTLTIYEVDEFLETLTTLPKKNQFLHFKSFIKKCTGNDLKVVIRLIKHDLRMSAGTKHVFESIHPNAYLLFQSCRDLKTVVNTCWVSPVKKIEIADSPKPVKRSPKRKLPAEIKTPSKKIKIEEHIVVEPEEVVKEEVIVERRKSVPNYFERVKLLLEEEVIEAHAEWVRYFIAYGGTVLKSDEYEKATHVLHLEDTVAAPISMPCPKTARHVIVEWIKDTVAKESLQDWRPYTVRWQPGVKG